MPSAVDFEIINIEPMNDYISECEIKYFIMVAIETAVIFPKQWEIKLQTHSLGLL